MYCVSVLLLCFICLCISANSGRNGVASVDVEFREGEFGDEPFCTSCTSYLIHANLGKS